MVTADCEFCIVTDVISVCKNELLLIETTDDGIIILPCNPENWKQLLFIIFTVGGIIILDNAKQDENDRKAFVINKLQDEITHLQTKNTQSTTRCVEMLNSDNDKKKDTEEEKFFFNKKYKNNC